MKKIVVASGNKGKLKEISNLFPDFEIIPLKEIEERLNKKLEVEENQNTFIANALQKATMLSKQIGDDYIVMADDSGISIDGLDGFPGVHTARWMDADDHTKNLALLEKMEGNDNRGCHYTTAIALCSQNFKVAFETTLNGTMTHEVRGNNGFGFDEIFEVLGGKTLAELTDEEKMKLSPRREALDHVKKFLD